jgi:hypothetical protein
MAFHQFVQSVLLAGARLPAAVQPAPVPAPAPLATIVAAVAPDHAACNRRAIEAGHRYRSAFWAIYLLSALAVLCAVLPLALGWDDTRHPMHTLAGFWAVAEVVVICVLGLTYWRGHHHDWQGRWLAERTESELAWYLPLIAPLLAFAPGGPVNWYRRLFGDAAQLPAGNAIDELCARLEPDARTALAGAWADPAFVTAYVGWAVSILGEQRAYHERVAHRHDALRHRVHRVNAWLFGLTLLGATAHLFVHTLWLSLATIFFPALGASLHGALAQTEAYRLAAASRRLSQELEDAIAGIAASAQRTGEHTETALRTKIVEAVALILGEHKDWHMLVRPHHLPLG